MIFRLFRLQSGNRRPGMRWDSIVIFRLFPSQSAYKRKKISTFSVPKTTNSARKMESPWHSNSLVFRPQKRGGGILVCASPILLLSPVWLLVGLVSISSTLYARTFLYQVRFFEWRKKVFFLYIEKS